MPRLVLYVEDDVNDVELVRLALADAGSPLMMETVPDGAGAIAYLSGMGKFADRARFPLPSLILLDLTLRGMNGFEVLGWMQNEPARTMPPVIVFSYSKQENDVQRAAELGAKCFITKPVTSEAAIAVIRSIHDYLGETNANNASPLTAGSLPPAVAPAPPLSPVSEQARISGTMPDARVR